MEENTLTPDKLRIVTGGATGVGIRFGFDGGPSAPGQEQATELPASAQEPRRSEFELGRLAARDALTDLGAAVAPIGTGTSGEPLWPTGIIGSITHTRGLAVAVAGWLKDFIGIGVDVESASRRAGDRTYRRICTPAEIEWVEAATDPDSRAMMIFCAKEAVYKALSAVGGAGLGFQDVEFTPEDEDTMAGRIKGGAAPGAPRRFTARTVVTDGFLVACVLVPRSAVAEEPPEPS